MMGERTAAASNQEWLNGVYEKLLIKMKAQCDRVGINIPYTTGEDGMYRDITETPYRKTPDGGITMTHWTNGFWPGMLWQMYHTTGDESYKAAAVGVEKRLEVVLEDPESLGHDLGFMFLQSSVANYRVTGDGQARRRGCWPRRSWPPGTIWTGGSSGLGWARGTANRAKRWGAATSGAG